MKKKNQQKTPMKHHVAEQVRYMAERHSLGEIKNPGEDRGF
jgi:hypothetical protein